MEMSRWRKFAFVVFGAGYAAFMTAMIFQWLKIQFRLEPFTQICFNISACVALSMLNVIFLQPHEGADNDDGKGIFRFFALSTALYPVLLLFTFWFLGREEVFKMIYLEEGTPGSSNSLLILGFVLICTGNYALRKFREPDDEDEEEESPDEA